MTAVAIWFLAVDELVLRGMAKWPDVPAVFGWLSLDRRGNWRIKGERVSNPGVSAFIGRNYERDDEGRWFFQNGPQRVFVTLDYTPLVYRVTSGDGTPLELECHTGRAIAIIKGGWLDQEGTLLLQTEHGAGLVNDHDLGRLFPYLIDINGNPLDDNVLIGVLDLLLQQLPAPLWLKFHDDSIKIEPIRSIDVPQRFSFVLCPAPPSLRQPMPQ